MNGKLKIVFLVCFILLYVASNSQSRDIADSLKLELSLEKDVQKKMDILLELAKIFRNSDHDAALMYAGQAADLGEQHNSVEIILLAYLQKARIYWRKSDYKSSMEFIENYGSGCEDLNGTGWSQYFELGPAILTSGQSHDLIVSSGYTGNFTSIWIDFNDDGLLTIDERVLENYWIELANQLYTVALEIPADATPGVHSMRARTNFANFCDDPCELYNYGEAEDYLVEIIEGGTTEDCEDFDALTAGGYVAEQLGDPWDTWSGNPGSAEDALATDALSYSPDNSFVVTQDVDLILRFGDVAITSGQWLYSHMMYVASGNQGYFNVQTDPLPGTGWNIDLYFNDGGTGVFAGQSTEAFTYTQDTWFLVEINYDLDNGMAQVLFDGELILQFENTLTIGGIDYFGASATDEAYIDDVCFVEGWEILQLEPPTNLVLSVSGLADFILEWDAPSGEKSAVITNNGMISPGSVEKSPHANNTPAPPSEELFDLLFDFTPAGTSEAGIETDGEYIYTSVWNGSGVFLKYDQQGNYIGELSVAGASGCRDLAYNGTYFYGSAASTTIFEMDFDLMVMVSSFSGPAPCRAIAYNEVEDALYCNNWSEDIVKFDMSGANLGSFPVGPVGASYYGLAFDNYSGGTYLWGYAQVGTNTNELVQIELPSGVETGVYFDVGSIIDPAGSGIAGGLCIDGAFVPDFWSIIGCMQGISLWGLELAGNTSLQGYNVYYSLNDDPFELIGFTTGTTYTHTVTEPIWHCYYITAVYDSGESGPSNTACELWPVSVEENFAISTQIYPNPASSVVNIKSDFNIQHVTVYNFAGQVVANEKVVGNVHHVNVANFNPGVYIFQLKMESGIMNKRVIVE